MAEKTEWVNDHFCCLCTDYKIVKQNVMLCALH